MTPAERSLLASLEGVLGLGPDAAGRARLAAFRVVYLEAVADHALTAAEERTLGHVRTALELDGDAVTEHREVVSPVRLAAYPLPRLRDGVLYVVTGTSWMCRTWWR